MKKLSKRMISIFLVLVMLSNRFTVFTLGAYSETKVDMLSKNTLTVYLGNSVFGRCDYTHDLEDAAFTVYTDAGSFYIAEITSVKSSNTAVATVKLLENGTDIKITPIAEGTTTVTVYAYGCDEDDEATDYYDTIKINVKPVPASKITVSSIPNQNYTGKSIKPNVTVKYGAKVLKKDTDYRLSYIDNKNVGKATVVVTFIGKYSGSKSKNFNIVPTINKQTAEMYTASKLTLKVKTSEEISWKSSNEKVATVNSSGVVTAVKKGSVTITATTGGKKLTCKINVLDRSLNKTELNMYVGHTTTLTYTGGSGTVKWKSSNKKVISVDSNGVLTAKGSGTATITATRNGVKLTCTVKVYNQALNKHEISLYIGKTKTLKLKGAYKKVTWKSSNTSVATVDKNGVVKGKKKGEATITAKHDGKTYTCKVTVKKKS